MQEKINIICCSTDNWDDIWRRRQHICQEFSKKDWIDKILFVEPAISVWNIFRNRCFSQFANAGKVRKINNKIYAYKPIWLIPFVRFKLVRDVNLYIYLIQVKLKVKLLNLNKIISWFSHPMYVVIAGKFNESLIWYDCTDDWSVMPAINKRSAKIFKRQQKNMLKKANMVTAVSDYLLNQAKEINKNSHLIPNGVDFNFYNCSIDKDSFAPEDIKNISRPILGYVGSIWGDRLDFELIKYMAKRKENWSLVFVGPVTAKIGIDCVGKFKNVHFLGKKSYKDLPNYINNFDICMIPHRKNKLTESMNPIKLFEYLATGKPIITTDIAGARDFKDVFKVARNYEEFVNFSEDLLKEDGEDLKNKRLQYAKENSWQERVEEIERTFKIGWRQEVYD